jgi:hypothetical protein
MYQKLSLDATLFKQSNEVLIKALQGGKALTREALNTALKGARISADPLRLSYICMHAELDGIICSGPRQGAQFTYALLEERVPKAKTLTTEEALAALTTRYFNSRGLATVQDFVYWSGLTTQQAKEGIALVEGIFEKERIDGMDYFFPSTTPLTGKKFQTTFLMPDYDEYGMSYKNRSALFNPKMEVIKSDKEAPTYNRMLVLDGFIVGSWKRVITKDKVHLDLYPTVQLSAVQTKKITAAATSFAHFLNKTAEIKLHQL